MSTLNQFFPTSSASSGIKLIQSGSASFGWMSTSLSVQIPIAVSNTGNSILIFSSRLSNLESWTDACTYTIYGTFSNTTHLIFGRGKQTNSPPVVEWQVIEYNTPI